jgi:hypothetical protein
MTQKMIEKQKNRRHHGKSISVELDLHPLVDLSLTQRYISRRCVTLQSA